MPGPAIAARGGLLTLLALSLLYAAPVARAGASNSQQALVHVDLQRVLADLKTALRYAADQQAGDGLELHSVNVTLQTVAVGELAPGLRVPLHHPDSPTVGVPTQKLILQLDLPRHSRRSGPDLILPAQPLVDLIGAAARSVQDAGLEPDVRAKAVSIELALVLAVNRGGVTEYQFVPLTADADQPVPGHFVQRMRLNFVLR